MNRRLRGAALVAVVAPFFIASCVHSTPTYEPKSIKNTPESGVQTVSGRLVLRTPQGRESALFTLEGSTRQGSLALDTPLGTAFARLSWGPNSATWQRADGSPARTASTVAELMRDALGWALPLEALFAWGQGADLPALPASIKVDMTARAQGRILVESMTEGWSVLIQLEPPTP